MPREDLLDTITTNLPNYDELQSLFLEHFPLFWKLGPIYYSAMIHVHGFQGLPEEVATVYLCGIALERVRQASEEGNGDVWHPQAA